MTTILSSFAKNAIKNNILILRYQRINPDFFNINLDFEPLSWFPKVPNQMRRCLSPFLSQAGTIRLFSFVAYCHRQILAITTSGCP